MTTTTLPAAFQDDLSEWTVTLELRPTIRRWKPPHLRLDPVTKDITVVAPDELSALLLGRRAGYTVLHARSKVEYIAPPTCTVCGASVAASNDSGLCRQCAAKKVAPKCIDCGKETKGFSKTNRCGGCSFKATMDGRQTKQQVGHNGLCEHCGTNPISMSNRTGFCRSCSMKKTVDGATIGCVVCDKPLGANNTTGLCKDCHLTARRKVCSVCGVKKLDRHNTLGVCRSCRAIRPPKVCSICSGRVSPKSTTGKCHKCSQLTRRPQEKPHVLIAALKEKVA